MPSMSRYTNLLPSLLLMSIFFASSRSGSFRNDTKMSEKEPSPTFSTPSYISKGIANNKTTETNSKSTTSILLSSQTREGQSNITSTPSTTISYSEEHSKPSQTPLDTTGSTEPFTNTGSNPQAGSAKRVENSEKKRSTVLAVSLVSAFCLSTFGVVAAVFFVRWKRTKKMKRGFQEEMAVICFHDELASEALYSSWKPFMDGNENNKVKLVIETQPNDASTREANT